MTLNYDKIEELVSLIKTSKSPRVLAALAHGRHLDEKHGENRSGRASFYAYVATVAAKESGMRFTKGTRIAAGKLFSEKG